jgi:hypothetical protein
VCGGVSYAINRKEVKIYFPNPQAQLPILLKNRDVVLHTWGRREQQAGRLPLGGWARHDSILAGKWDYTNPKAVKIAVEAFMEKDKDKQSHWFKMKPDTYIQGLMARFDDEYRVYVVTIKPNSKAIHDRCPRIIGANLFD